MNDEFHEKDECDKGGLVDVEQTGDDECNAYDYTYACGGIWHNNYMDILGDRTHDCWWDCSRCKKHRKEVKKNAD